MIRLARNAALLTIVPAMLSLPLLAASAAVPDEPVASVKPSIAALDEKNGFRGAKFGTPLSAFKNLRLLEDGYWKFFSRTDESPTFGGGTLTEVGYGFYKEELGAVIVKASGPNCDLVLEGLKALYGPPVQPDRTVKNFVWDGQKVSLSFDSSQSAKGCYATFISVPEHERAIADEETAARRFEESEKDAQPK
jgi:hypothetical protein